MSDNDSDNRSHDERNPNGASVDELLYGSSVPTPSDRRMDGSSLSTSRTLQHGANDDREGGVRSSVPTRSDRTEDGSSLSTGIHESFRRGNGPNVVETTMDGLSVPTRPDRTTEAPSLAGVQDGDSLNERNDGEDVESPTDGSAPNRSDRTTKDYTEGTEYAELEKKGGHIQKSPDDGFYVAAPVSKLTDSESMTGIISGMSVPSLSVSDEVSGIQAPEISTTPGAPITADGVMDGFSVPSIPESLATSNSGIPGAYFVRPAGVNFLDGADSIGISGEDEALNAVGGDPTPLDAVIPQEEFETEIQQRILNMTVDAENVTRVPNEDNDGEAPSSSSSKRALRVTVLLVILILCAIGVTFAVGLPNHHTHAPTPVSGPSTSGETVASNFDLGVSFFGQFTTNEVLLEESSPQNKALSWIVARLNMTLFLEDSHDLSSHMKELFALVVLYFAMGGPNWPKEMNFLSYGSYCHWHGEDFNGILCDEMGHVASLTLDDVHNLNGTIPSEIKLLSRIQWLAINGPGLHGTVPPSLGHLTLLEFLHLSASQMSGPIPTSLSKLSRLDLCALHYNYLTGSIPKNLFLEATSLRVLALYDNLLSGTIPELNNNRLEEVFFNQNLFSGTIPDALYGPMLSGVFLGFNYLTGTLSNQLNLLEEVETFSVGENQLGGTIPTEIGMMTNLRSLNLGDNSFMGTIPSELGLLTRLSNVFLGNNDLSGTVPKSLSSLSPDELGITRNNLVGNLDMFCEKSPMLTKIWADCLGREPEIRCPCCISCCDAQFPANCESNSEARCGVEKTQFEHETGGYFQEIAGTNCTCMDDGTLTCHDKQCQVCNKAGTMCADQSWIVWLDEFGYHAYNTTFQYVVGSNATVTIESRYVIQYARVYNVRVDGQLCDSATPAKCSKNGFSALQVLCNNLAFAGIVEPCGEQVLSHDDSPLAVIAAQDPVLRGEGCAPRILPPVDF